MEVLYALESIRSPVLDEVMSLVTQLGGETVFMAVALIIFWCVDKYSGYYMLTVGFVGTLANQFLKLAFRIPRPWVRDPAFSIVESAREAATGYSFPSGHTQNALTVFGCVARCSKRWLWRGLCMAAIALIALSRMYLGVHTPADVGVSLVVGAVLVLGLYPLFEHLGAHPDRMYWILGAMLVLCLGFTAFVSWYPFPADIDPDNLAEGTANAWKLTGAVLGMLAAYPLDRRHIHFETAAPVFVQVLKTALGLALLVGIKALLKQPLLVLLNGHAAAHAIRYGLVVFFAAAVWPMTFRFFSRLGAKGQ